ncbi:MAG: DUF4037 domain-containing protein [Phycisphaeraceae bacterium]|nr:DUF4037 domain-containing protein [Phycisphaeraceae bacterium]
MKWSSLMVKGMQLAGRFFEEAIAPVIEICRPSLRGRYAAGLIGFGSDVLGHDDAFSQDHEWGCRCLLWLPDDEFRHADALRRCLGKRLPSWFMGFPTRFKRVPGLGMIPASDGEPNVEVTTFERYLRFQFGMDHFPPRRIEWLCIPEQKLLEFTRGRLFRDPGRRWARLRQRVAYLPNPIWRFKLFYAWDNLHWHLDLVGLSVARGELLSAHLTLQRIVDRLMDLAFLLSGRYRPGTLKWIGREFHSLPLARRLGPLLKELVAARDPGQTRSTVEAAIRLLVREHNRLGITSKAALLPPDPGARGQVSFSLRDVVAKLRRSLPSDLRSLPIQGACDQWLTNDDVLIDARQGRRFAAVYARS